MISTKNRSNNSGQHRTIGNTVPGTLISRVCMFTMVLMFAAAIVCGTAGAELSYIDENANTYKQPTSKSTSGTPADIDWIEKTPMSVPGSAFGYAVVDGNIYTIGGITTTVQRYNPATDMWEQDTNNGGSLAPLPQQRAVLCCGVINGKIHAIGGWDENEAYRSDHFIYDPDSNTWSTGPSIPQYPIGQFAATVNNKIYVFGGWWGSYMDLVFEYSDETGWTSKSPMPTARNHGTTAVYDGKIYVIGGEFGYQPADVVEIYDPATDTWTTGLAPMPTPQHWLGSSGSPVSAGIIYVLGPGDTAYAYDPQSDSWDTLNSMPDSAYGITAINGLICAIGPEHTFQGAYLPWSMFHHNAQHTGRSPYTGPHNVNVLWTYETGDSVGSSPAIDSSGIIYVGSEDCKLYAINPDGTLKWTYQTEGGIYSSPAIGNDGTIYVGSRDHNLYAIKSDGTLKWNYSTGGEINAHPTIGHDGTIYVGSYDHNLYALNPDGILKCSYDAGQIVHSSPAIDQDGIIYIGSSNGYLHALYPNCTVKWISDSPIHGIWTHPALSPDETVVYHGADDGYLYARYTSDGSIRWKSPYTYGGVQSSPAIDSDGTIYVGTQYGNLWAINLENGSLEWDYYMTLSAWSSPAIGADGTIYFGTDYGHVYAMKQNGTVKWVYNGNCSNDGHFKSSPAIGNNGALYIGSTNGKLYAFGSVAPIISITPQTQEVSLGGVTTVNLTLNEAPTGLSGYNLTVSLSNTSVAEILSISFPLWASLNDNSTFPADSVWIKGVDLGDQVGVGATDSNLGTLTLRGDDKGTSDISITVTKMDADDGYPINPDTTSGTMEVTDVVPLPGYSYPPTDPDQDGLYEDLNGNGMIDFDDVVLYFEYLEWIEDNEPNACFDFNGNGWTDFDDLVKLFEEV